MSDFGIVKREFYMLTLIPLEERLTNRSSDNSLRNDAIFPFLAERAFDSPRILKVLKGRINFWLSCDSSESTLALAGYIYYLDRNFIRAKSFFLKAIEKNPENLDSWFDLAFCLYHCSPKLNKLAKAILFNFDLYIKFFKKANHKKCNIRVLEEIYRKLVDNKLDYSFSYAKSIDSRDLRTLSKKNLHPRAKNQPVV